MCFLEFLLEKLTPPQKSWLDLSHLFYVILSCVKAVIVSDKVKWASKTSFKTTAKGRELELPSAERKGS